MLMETNKFKLYQPDSSKKWKRTIGWDISC